LASHLDEFAARLASNGYAGSTAREKIRLLADLSRWLDRRKLEVGDLDEPCIHRFLSARRRRGFVKRWHAATCRALLTYLRERGDVPAEAAAVDAGDVRSPIENDYARYLSRERGLAPATLCNYLPTIGQFLRERFGAGCLKLDELRPRDIHRFILRHARTGSRGRAQLIVTALRSFLRYLHQQGHVAADLAAATPGVANWRLAHLPKTLSTDEVQRLLNGCDRSTAAGQRDYAVLLLLARLGLRAGEVVALRLDDIDWDSGVVTIRGKGSRLDTLPLPYDAGEALVRYLHDVRPRCVTRQVFIRLRAPRRGFTSSAAICDIVRRALARADLDPACKGAHLLRHTLASTMLRQGASLAEIGDILRHRRLETTQIYAKVDVAALRALSPPWPGAAS